MNSLYVTAACAAAFFLGYRFYANRLSRLFGVDPRRKTPAETKYDGIDYVPARSWLVLFGHHFSSIAGAGPIIGPVIACVLWGWLPALVWIVIGTIFIGGAHDFGSLVCSVREGGKSIPDIASSVISYKAKLIFSLFVWLALILVIAVFTYLCAQTFVREPKIVLPSLGLIPVAVLIGFLLYRLKANNAFSTVLGLALLAGLLFAGNLLPINSGINTWIVVLLIYCFAASVIPVHLLLQPRDYLSGFLLFAGVVFGYAGLFLTHPAIKQPAFVAFKAQEGGLLWPMLCVTVACGAVSGFHALISSGTTSKQLASERFAKRIGYGGMVVEGLVAVMAVLAVCAGLGAGDLSVLLKEAGPINSFSAGYGELTKGILYGWGGFIAVTILNAFILTTLDTATRISRYLTEELFGVKNRYFATAIVVVLGGIMALTGAWEKLWPVFGASNQLVAALALFVISCWLLANNKSLNLTMTMPPAIFMFITTIAALAIQARKYFRVKDYLLFGISVVLLALAFYLLAEIIASLRRNRAGYLLQNKERMYE